jgi:CheY-like chemotaxis protein
LAAQLELTNSVSAQQVEQDHTEQTIAIVDRIKEMRAPLQDILSEADHLAKKTAETPMRTNAYQNLRFAARDLLALINDVLQVSDVETEKLTLNQLPFDPVKSLSWLRHHFADGLPEHQAVSFDFDEIISVPVLGDGDALIRACALALAHTRDENPKASIQFIASGFGIDSQYELQLQIVVKTNQTTHQQPDLQNPTVRRVNSLIGMQYGHHHIESLTDGYIWVLRIPYPVVEKTGLNVSPTALLGVKVLLVEDHAMNRMLTEKLLKQYHIDVDTAVDGADALEKLSEKTYDLILMDLMMPVMDGYVATRHIRQSDNEYLRHIPIIALTASAYVDETEKAQMFGMNDYLGKPFSPDELLYIMARCWQQHLRMFGQPVNNTRQA